MYFKDHWSYTKCVDTFKAMLDDRRKQFVCGMPYQLSILEGLLDPEAVADEMSESDFSEVKWSINSFLCSLNPLNLVCLRGVALDAANGETLNAICA